MPFPCSSGTEAWSAETFTFTADQFQQLMTTVTAAGNVEARMDAKLGKLKEEISREQEVYRRKRQSLTGRNSSS